MSEARRNLGAVVGLSAVMLVIVGVVAFSALRSPREANGANAAGAVKAAPGAVEAGLEAAGKYQAQGKFAEAGAILAKLIEAHPADRELRRAHAQALMGQKKYAEAYEAYVAAVALLPSGTAERIASGGDPLAAQLHFEAGTCANMAGLVDRAIEHYSMAQTADRAEAKYPLYLAMVQLKKGTREDEAQATASLMRAAHLNPELGEAWGTMAEIALRHDQLGIAAQHLERARKLQPEALRWRLVEARMLNRRGEAEQAAALLTALGPAQRNEPAVLTVLAESYGLMRRPIEAARMYAEAFRASATPNAELAYQAALWYERAGEMERSVEMARAAGVLGHADARDLAERLAGVGD